jgi:hypothetical protein
MKVTSGIQVLGDLYNAPAKSHASDVTSWSRPGSEHMEVSLTLSSPLDHRRTLGREKPMTFGDTAPTSLSGLHQFQSVGSNALQIIASKCSNSHLGPRPLKTISAHTFGCSGGNKFDNRF